MRNQKRRLWPTRFNGRRSSPLVPNVAPRFRRTVGHGNGGVFYSLVHTLLRRLRRDRFLRDRLSPKHRCPSVELDAGALSQPQVISGRRGHKPTGADTTTDGGRTVSAIQRCRSKWPSAHDILAAPLCQEAGKFPHLISSQRFMKYPSLIVSGCSSTKT